MIKFKLLFLSLLGFLLSLSPMVNAYWRMSCMGVVARGQIDPVVSPGKVSAHLHTIKGASAISLNSSAEDLLASSCTSCEIAQDKSAYWTPGYYFYDTDKQEFEQVQEVSGHLSYYKYVPHTIASGVYTNPIAIPNGMKMISGNPFRRNFTLPVPDPPLPWSGNDATQDALRQKAVGFNCLNYAAAPEGTLQRHFLPDKNFLETECPDGIRLEVLFPTCWDGVQVESDDLTSHLAYGDAGANGGNCPKGYDTVIMQLLFETIYPTTGFVGRNGYFTFAQGDPTGYGYHGDALIAWEDGIQQEAVDKCGNPDPTAGAQAQDGVPEHCNVFSINSPASQSACTIQSTGLAIQANFQALQTALPGNNPIQFGPQQATIPAASDPIQTPPPSLPSAIVPSSQSVAARTSDSTNPIANQFLQVGKTASPESSTSTSTSTAAATTQAPIQANAVLAGEKILNTVTYTSGGAVYEIVNVEIVQTTTIFEDSQIRKRAEHLHQHAHRGRY